MSRTTRLWILGLAVFFLFTLGGEISQFLVNILWFKSVGFSSVFWTIFWSKVGLGVLAFVIAYACIALNLHIARLRSNIWGYNPLAGTEISPILVREKTIQWGWVVPILLAILFAIETTSHWLPVQAFRNQVPAQITDPIFSKDISFYLFSLPLLTKLKGLILTLLWVTAVMTALTYLFLGGLLVNRKLARAPRVQLAILFLVIVLVYAWGYWLARFDLLYSPGGAAYGASYTDLNAQLPAYNILIFFALGIAILLGVSALRRNLRFLVGGIVLFIAAAFLGTVVYPGLVQKLSVEPNELERETPYITNTIRYTRIAYGLDDVETQAYEVEETLTREALDANQVTVQNVRLWDWRPLRDTYRQLQEIRPYYSFHDVDVDRYLLEGEYRQVMHSARELDYSQIPQTARTWVNLHLKYFHIRDIPPVSKGGIEVTTPGIYFGELTSRYSLVKTSTEEFDYPVGDTNKFTFYEADAGIPIGNFFSRLLFAWHLKSSKIILTGHTTPESQILLYRTLKERIPKIAPFLYYDKDPYLVIHDGKLFWMQDAYTTSRRFPYSQPYGGLNYIRNSVKVIMDAYTGECTFYVFEPDDPLIQTYWRIFPDLFRPASEMPEGLRRHIRYPEDLFRVQAQIYATYHMTDPQVFYNREDLWQIPRETQRGSEVDVVPYYVIMRLPGAEAEEMILMQPFVPNRKDNMIAWMAARCDEPGYGERVVYFFPKQKLIYGPRQIEARIDQDARISQLLSLWSQRGSQVIRGNLLVIPIGESLLYVEPLYLQAEKAELPQLKRVIVASGNRIAMAPTLNEALSEIFGAPSAEPSPESIAAGRETDREIGLEIGEEPITSSDAQEALRIYEEGQSALRRGDWGAYGRAQERLEAILRRLIEESEEGGS
jgi:uncharacterized membrane protein (UPF0182 family)